MHEQDCVNVYVPPSLCEHTQWRTGQEWAQCCPEMGKEDRDV